MEGVFFYEQKYLEKDYRHRDNDSHGNSYDAYSYLLYGAWAAVLAMVSLSGF
jgi:hypothetical protein